MAHADLRLFPRAFFPTHLPCGNNLQPQPLTVCCLPSLAVIPIHQSQRQCNATQSKRSIRQGQNRFTPAACQITIIRTISYTPHITAHNVCTQYNSVVYSTVSVHFAMQKCSGFRKENIYQVASQLVSIC